MTTKTLLTRTTLFVGTAVVFCTLLRTLYTWLQCDGVESENMWCACSPTREQKGAAEFILSFNLTEGTEYGTMAVSDSGWDEKNDRVLLGMDGIVKIDPKDSHYNVKQS